MSRENLELVRRIYDEGLLDGDPERMLEVMTPDIEYVNPEEAVTPGIRRGQEEVAEALAGLRDFDSTSHDVHELFAAGDSVVVAEVTFRARSRGSELELAQREAHTWTIRAGRVVRFEWGRDLQAALEAAGLREPPAQM